MSAERWNSTKIEIDTLEAIGFVSILHDLNENTPSSNGEENAISPTPDGLGLRFAHTDLKAPMNMYWNSQDEGLGKWYTQAFDDLGRIRLRTDRMHGIDLSSLTTSQLYAMCIEYFGAADELIDPGLNLGHEAGFNTHGRKDHTGRVMRIMFHVFGIAKGIDPTLTNEYIKNLDEGIDVSCDSRFDVFENSYECKKAALIVTISDLLNIWKRRDHQHGAFYVAAYLMPDLLNNLEFAKDIHNGIVHHDEKSYSGLVDQLVAEFGVENTPEILLALNDNLGDGGNLHLVGDKVDGTVRGRVSRKKIEERPCNADAVYEINVLSELEQIFMSGDCFSINYRFNPYMDSSIIPPYGYTSAQHGWERIWVSNFTQREYRTNKNPYFYTWFRNRTRFDYKRIRAMAHGAFSSLDAANDNQHANSIKTSFKDYIGIETPGQQSESYMEISTHFGRDTLAEDLEILSTLFMHKDGEERNGVGDTFFDQAKESFLNGNRTEFMEDVRSYFDDNPQESIYKKRLNKLENSVGDDVVCVDIVIHKDTLDKAFDHLKLIFDNKNFA